MTAKLLSAAVGAALALLVVALVGIPGCDSNPTEAGEVETRSVEASERGEEAAHVLLGEATEAEREADRLRVALASADDARDGLSRSLRLARARLDSALARPVPDNADVSADTSPPPLDRDTVRVYLAAERTAADSSLAQCDDRVRLARAVAEVEASRARYATAAADSALGALFQSRVAYRDADARATALAASRRRLYFGGGVSYAEAPAPAIVAAAPVSLPVPVVGRVPLLVTASASASCQSVGVAIGL